MLKHFSKRCSIVFVLITALSGVLLPIAGSALAQTVIVRVDANNGSTNPPGQGADWGEQAYEHLQDALVHARSLLDLPQPPDLVEVWVAAGNYTPDPYCGGVSTDCDIGATFELNRDNLHLYGGFAGNETALEQRNWVANVTVLSGFLPDDDGDRSRHVVTVPAGMGRSTRLDGVRVVGGDATGATFQNGGGILVVDAGPLIRHCKIAGCAGSGVGAYRTSSAVTSDAAFVECIISDNIGAEGAGLYVDSAFITIVNTEIRRNTTPSDGSSRGGGIFAKGAGSLGVARLALVNVLVAENRASTIGAGVFVDRAQVSIRNSTIAWNRLWTSLVVSQGVGLYLSTAGASATTIIANSIIARNSSSTSQAEIYNGIDGYLHLQNSDVFPNSISGGPADLNDVIFENPNFVDYQNGDFSLQPFSPCRNRGLRAYPETH